MNGVVEDVPTYLSKADRKNRSTQFLLCGTSSGLIGLFTSLFLLIFRVNCDTEFRLGSYVTHANSTTSMCKSPIMQHLIVPLDGDRNTNPLAATIPGALCSTDADCVNGAEGLPAFCSGGPDGLTAKDYCTIGPSAGQCLCKSIIYDCGVKHYFDWEYKGSDVIQGCVGATQCSVGQKESISLWKAEVGALGCKTPKKTELSDVLLWIQRSLETQGIFQPLKAASDPVWDPIRTALQATPDVSFNNYWPSTISESVSRAGSPEGTIFLGFMLLGSIMLLLSNYTFECETVSLPHRVLPYIGINWDTARQLLPPSGLILLAVVSMKPESQMFNLCDVTMTAVHLIGAQFCFIVYLLCEVDALLDKDNVRQMTGQERNERGVLVIVGAVSMATFGIVYGILMLFMGGIENPHVTPPFGGYSDLYGHDGHKPRGASLNNEVHQRYLMRPAEGVWKFLKILSYTAEFLVAASILISHLVIWRHMHKRALTAEMDESDIYGAMDDGNYDEVLSGEEGDYDEDPEA